MVRHINTDWKTHVAETGVTCYTCHRGNRSRRTSGSTIPVLPVRGGYRREQHGQEQRPRRRSVSPRCPMTHSCHSSIRPMTFAFRRPRAADGDRQSIKQTEWTYGLMMHFSQSLGVNCTFCHNIAFIRRLGAKHAAADDRVVRDPHGTRSEHTIIWIS